MPVKTFEAHTQPLTDYETRVLVPVIIRGLRSHEGPDSAITSAAICDALRKKGYKISDVTLRRCVKYIQRNDLLNWVVATANGFFYTQDPRIVKEQIDSLKSREEAIRTIRSALERSLEKAS